MMARLYILLLYNDYMLTVEIDQLKYQFSIIFEIKDLVEAKILGMVIERDRPRGIICLTQSQYVCKVGTWRMFLMRLLLVL